MHAIGHWNRLDQDDCNGVAGEFGMVDARALGSSENLMLRTLHGPHTTCPNDFGESARYSKFCPSSI